MNQLDQLKQFTTIVADTGDIDSIGKYQPEDATTNPSLILKAIESGKFDSHLQNIQKDSKDIDDFIDQIGVEIGNEILAIVPGYVSTEVDARLSFDTAATIEKARNLIRRYESKGWAKDRILIKIASTWEGIKAAEILEKEGIRCNLTLLFSMTQAKACAQANVTLISPFVGRILDWYKNSTGQEYSASNDPGVLSVQEIYKHYKAHHYATIVMGASFRNIGEITELSGCDRLTIAPALLEQLANKEETISRTLPAFDINSEKQIEDVIDEASFRFEFNGDAMATEKLAEGIRNFVIDQNKLQAIIQTRFFS